MIYTFGQTPVDVIRAAAREQCPDGYPMTIRSQDQWTAIAKAWNQGIDSYLEAVTERSKADPTTGKVNVHPDELHVLLRRFYEADDEESSSLRSAILSTLGIEEV
jgi:hypothetical protein